MKVLISERPTSMPTREHFARNLIGGRWQFPAAPFEFDICNPTNGSVSATVPLSSRLEVAKAITAARTALTEGWEVRAERLPCLDALVELLAANVEALAELQELETGLCAADSRYALEATLRFARSELDRAVAGPDDTVGGVSGHILSWGLPLTEVVTSTLLALVRGGTVVVAPSLRGPLGPILAVLTWSTGADLVAALTAARARDGVATVWGSGAGAGAPAPLPHGLIVDGPQVRARAGAADLPPRWRGTA